MDLADKVIHANEQEIIEKAKGDTAPEGYYTDDMGYWVEQDIRRHKDRFALYIFMRCRKLNKHLHLRRGEFLYNSHTLIRETPLDIAKLADLPEVISAPQAAWVYKRLVATVPRLSEKKIEVAPGLLWNFETLSLENADPNKYITIGERK